MPSPTCRFPVTTPLCPSALVVAILTAALPAQGSWTPARSAAGSPGPRLDHDMVHDSARGTILLFGGHRGGTTILGDTWEWNGATWTRRRPSRSPGIRSGHAMAYDAARNRTILFGGAGSSTGPMWGWDGNNWSALSPATLPASRTEHAMAYDRARQRIVMFGGLSSNSVLADTWEWDGVDWTRRTPTNSPPARMGHAMAYDPAGGRVVLFGGAADVTTSTLLDDTWTWDGTRWSQERSSYHPSARLDHDMAFVPSRRGVVLFGGAGHFRTSFIDDTWQWDGSSWRKGYRTAEPSYRRGHAMAYDKARDQAVLFGGHYMDLFGYHYYRDDTHLFGPVIRASASNYGSACAGTNGPPVLDGDAPYLGHQAFHLELRSARPSSPCLFVLAWNPANTPLGGGCTAYVTAPIALQSATTDATGFAAGPSSTIPPLAALRGFTLHAQAVVLDPRGAWNGMALTAGRTLVIGD